MTVPKAFSLFLHYKGRRPLFEINPGSAEQALKLTAASYGMIIASVLKNSEREIRNRGQAQTFNVSILT